MKKAFIVLLALCVATGAFAQAKGKTAGPIEGAGNLGKFELKLTDNMRDGKNFQGVVQNPKLLLETKVTKGEKYVLKATYTTDRDVTRPIGVGFANMNGGWGTLSWRQPKGIDIPSPAVGGAEFPASKAGVPVTVEIEINILNSAPGTNPKANTLVFATLDTVGPVVISFTEFNLVRQ